ncbi:uncharacterized protein [Dermacentor albipictus]|uniref:uncharacterized protein isoform X2 n=1 Tax=Dermacentor albipictus TaxID=60249 RepID=UPI0038FC4670
MPSDDPRPFSSGVITIQPPSHFNFERTSEWPTWSQEFDDYRVASGLNELSEEARVRSLLYAMDRQVPSGHGKRCTMDIVIKIFYKSDDHSVTVKLIRGGASLVLPFMLCLLITAVVYGGFFWVLSFMGFQETGVAANSFAAWWQSTYPNGHVPPGSLFARLQSLGTVGPNRRDFLLTLLALSAVVSAMG